MEKNAKMALWESVQKTDPRHTKKVEFGRKFTSIDAHYQVMQATAAFGPVGIGWGYAVHHSTVSSGAVILASADVTLWHGERSNSFGPMRGMAILLNEKGHTDSDASKKALTDALTKLLSHLGFSADVFLGRFDDNKYVAQMTAEFKAAEKSAVSDADKAKADDFRAAIAGASDETDLARAAKDLAGCGLPTPLLDELRALYSAKRKEVAA